MATFVRYNSGDIVLSTDKIHSNAWTDSLNDLTTVFTASAFDRRHVVTVLPKQTSSQRVVNIMTEQMSPHRIVTVLPSQTTSQRRKVA